MKTTVFILFLIFLGGFHAYAQSSEVKVRLLFLQAEHEYGKGKFDSCIKTTKEVISILGGTRPRLEKLLCKSYFALRDIKKAQEHINLYFQIADKADVDYPEMSKLSSDIGTGRLSLAKKNEQAAIVKLQLDEDEDEDELLWRAVSQLNTVSSYERYLEDFPKGVYRYTAKMRMNVLKDMKPLRDQVRSSRKGLFWTFIVAGAGYTGAHYASAKADEFDIDSDEYKFYNWSHAASYLVGGVATILFLYKPLELVVAKRELSTFEKKNKHHFSLDLQVKGEHGLLSTGLALKF